jgi:L-cysteine desulfidase
MLTKEERTACEEVLKEELRLAMGCTEPIAIAYAAAILGDVLSARPDGVSVHLSGNIIKNVKSVIVPSSGGLHGIQTAIAAGIIAGHPENMLEVLSVLDETAHDKIIAFLADCEIAVHELISPCTFDLLLEGKAGKNTATVRISERHTNVVGVVLNGQDLTAEYQQTGVISNTAHADKSVLTVKNILKYAQTQDLSEIIPLIQRQIAVNMAIAEEGLKNDYGAAIGKLLYKNGQADLVGKAKAYAAAGSDARISGCELPVCIMSGSGNQGITTCVPIVVYAREMGIDEETLYKAVVVSDLITAHLKDGIGCLSAYCGAICAGVGAGAGVAVGCA